MLVVSFIAAFFLMPHVHVRVERFLHPTEQTAYQALTALQAFGNGGLLGRGPGEGMVKDILPDAHADFVFAVAGEEFGLVVCLLILFIFAAIVLRGLLRLVAENDHFVLLAAAGILVELRPAGLHQHGLLPGADSDQGHDAALHLLWRLLRLLGRDRDGHAAGTHAPPHRGRPRMRGPRVIPVVIAAGGTGGHFFPAEALAHALAGRGYRPVLMTDGRSAGRDSPAFAEGDRHVLPGAGIAGRGV